MPGRTTAVPFPAIECPTVPLGIGAIVQSDAVMLATLGMVRRELHTGLVAPLLHEAWMRSDWAIMRLRNRPLGAAAMDFVGELRREHEAARKEDAALCKRWEPGQPGSGQRRQRPGKTARRH